MRGRTSTTRVVRSIVAAAAAALCIAAPTFAAGEQGRARGEAHIAASCPLPLVVDRYDGYQLGVPSGWDLYRLGDELVVAKSSAGTEDAVIDPAIDTSGLGPQRFFEGAMGQLLPLLRVGGNAFSYRLTSSSGQLPEASLSGRVGSTAVSGEARVSVIADHTAHGSSLLVLSAYWAPSASFRSAASTLAAIGSCYAPRPAELFQIHETQAFTYSMPSGWSVPYDNAEGAIEISLGAAASAVYKTEIVTDSSVDSAPTLMSYMLAQLGLRVTQRLATVVTPAQREPGGETDQSEYLEFIGTNQGAAVHGMISVTDAVADGINGAVTRLALASTSSWDADSGAALRIAGGIQYHFSEDIQQWESASQQWEQFGQQVEGFDEALNNEDLVENPDTGQVFQAPYESYDQDGPDGPGYYDDSGSTPTKLKIITP